jgi:hypothetical protein
MMIVWLALIAGGAFLAGVFTAVVLDLYTGWSRKLLLKWRGQQ